MKLTVRHDTTNATCDVYDGFINRFNEDGSALVNYYYIGLNENIFEFLSTEQKLPIIAKYNKGVNNFIICSGPNDLLLPEEPQIIYQQSNISFQIPGIPPQMGVSINILGVTLNIKTGSNPKLHQNVPRDKIYGYSTFKNPDGTNITTGTLMYYFAAGSKMVYKYTFELTSNTFSRKELDWNSADLSDECIPMSIALGLTDPITDYASKDYVDKELTNFANNIDRVVR